jgi:acetoacetyl-CoA synthetase
MKVEIWDDDGKDISASGGKGELMVTKPFFSMPLTFWGDGGLQKYEKSYFDKFPGFWCHGDFAEKTRTGGFIIHGRSDGVLNPGGK